MKKNSLCYLCGKHADTDDHIPPKSFFPPENKINLIKVRCCAKCNQSYSLDDEAFYIFASSVYNRSRAGSWIWENQVMNSSFKRSPKLKQNVIDSLVNFPGGTSLSGIKYPVKRASNFLIRVTKGLIRYFHPEFDYSKSQFEISQINPTQEIVDVTLSKFIYDERGSGVFRFWRAFVSKDKPISVWVYVFYDGLMFMVTVDYYQIEKIPVKSI